MERIPYVIVGDAAIISVKSEEDAVSDETRRRAREILRRHPRLRAVYAKVETRGSFRVQRLILVEGEPVEQTWYRENGLWFRVTLGRVYVNPRLSTEHLEAARLLEKWGASNVLDMFSGVGGYAVTVAAFTSSARLVHANDANPYAVADLVASLYRNRRRIRSTTFIVTCEDAHRLPAVIPPTLRYDAIIMDYPQASEEFLREAARLAARETILLVYRVLREGEEHSFGNSIVDLLGSEGMRCTLLGVRQVLDYAPRKYVYRFALQCVSTGL